MIFCFQPMCVRVCLHAHGYCASARPEDVRSSGARVTREGGCWEPIPSPLLEHSITTEPSFHPPHRLYRVVCPWPGVLRVLKGRDLHLLTPRNESAAGNILAVSIRPEDTESLQLHRMARDLPSSLRSSPTSLWRPEAR